MKKLSILGVIILLVTGLEALSLSKEEITNMVSKIKKERLGIQLNTLDGTPNPFAIRKQVLEKKKVEEVKKVIKLKKTFTHQLTAILNNSGFIDGKWYRVGDQLNIYTITFIGTNSLVLKNGKEHKILKIPEREKKFKILKGDKK